MLDRDLRAARRRLESSPTNDQALPDHARCVSLGQRSSNRSELHLHDRVKAIAPNRCCGQPRHEASGSRAQDFSNV